MRSPQVENCLSPDTWPNYSDLQVLKSAAGYYIGTIHTEPEGSEMAGLEEPGSRDSVEYYPTREEAQHAFETRSWTQRWYP